MTDGWAGAPLPLIWTSSSVPARGRPAWNADQTPLGSTDLLARGGGAGSRLQQ